MSTLYNSESLEVYDRRADTSIALRDMPDTHNFVYNRNDWKWAASENAMARSANRISALKHKFKFVVVMHDDAYKSGYKFARMGHTNPESHKKEGVITCILGNNVAHINRHVPLTPWMLLHRAIHCLSLAKFKRGDYFERGPNIIGKLLDEKHNMSLGSILNSVNGGLGEFLRLIMTTRTARKHSFSTDGDLAPELFAQHHMGGIKFLRYEDWEARMKLIEDSLENVSEHWNEYPRYNMLTMKRIFRTKTKEEINSTMELLEQVFTDEAEELTNCMVGQVAVF